MTNQQEPYILMSRHDADLILDIIEFRTTYADACAEHNSTGPAQITDPEKLGLLKTIESMFKSAMQATNGIANNATFHLSDTHLKYLIVLVTHAYEDANPDSSLFDSYQMLRHGLIMADADGNTRPFKIAPKYRFELRTRDVCTAVYFSEEELRNLARGTHEAVVFNAVVPPDPTDS